jgi:hypothetical protein
MLPRIPECMALLDRPSRSLMRPDIERRDVLVEYFPLRVLEKYAGLSIRTLRSYLYHPVTPLPHFRVGGKILVKRSDYDAWLLRFRRCEPASLDTMVNDVLDSLR